VDSVSAVLQAAGFVASNQALQAVHVPEGYQVQAAPSGGILLRHEAIDEAVNEVSPSARTEQMLAGYARALHAAGFRVTSPARGGITIHPPAARQATPAHEPESLAHSRAGAAHRAPGRATTGNGGQPRQPTGGPATDAPAGNTRAEPQHPGPEALPAGDGPGQRQAQHGRERGGEGTNDDRTITPSDGPGHGEDLPQGPGDGQRRHLAEADRHAGKAFASGDMDRAYQLLTGTRPPDPERHQRRDQAETQSPHWVAKQEPPPVPHSPETAPCPHCGHPCARAAGEASPCLSCQTQARLKAAGFTADSPQITQAAEWNHAVIRSGDGQPETTGQPEPDPPEPHPQDTARPSELNTPEREKEACG
jgi:hypothetical protein